MNNVTGRASPKITTPCAEVRKQQVRDSMIAKVQTQRKLGIYKNRREARNKLMEICSDLSDVFDNGIGVLGHVRALNSDIPMSSDTDCNISCESNSQHLDVIHSPSFERDEIDDHTAILQETMHAGLIYEDNEPDEQDFLVALLGRDAYDELMIELEDVLMTHSDEPEPDCDNGCPEEPLEGELELGLDWDDERFIVCPFCKKLPMEIHERRCLASCVCSPPIDLQGLLGASNGSRGSVKATLEEILADEYER